MKVKTIIFTLIFASFAFIRAGDAKDFKYHKKATLKVGDSIVLKGVRSRNCGDEAPSWADVKRRLPKTEHGTFSNGGSGFTLSRSCGGRVGARGVKYTAKSSGKERLNIYDDWVRITVK